MLFVFLYEREIQNFLWRCVETARYGFKTLKPL